MISIAREILKQTLQILRTLRTCARAGAYARARGIAMGFIASISLFTFIAVSPAFADSNPANDSAALEIFITPNFDRGVEIDTANVHMNLGVMEMGVSTQTVRPATVTIVGNVLNNELNLSAEIVGGWTFDDDVTSTDTDKLAAWVLFRSATDPVMPAKSGELFDDANDALNSATASFGPVRVGTQNGNSGLAGRFEDGAIDMDSLAPQTKRHLWFYFRTPAITSFTTQQEIHYTLTVVPGP